MDHVPRWARIVASILAAVLAAGVTIALVDLDGDGRPDQVVIKRVPVPVTPPAVAVDGPDQDTKRDDALPLDQEAQEVVEGAARALPGTELDDPLRELGDGPVVLNEGPLAGQEFPGCRTRFVRNSSSRAGATVREIVWHYTVSRNRPGWSDVDGLTAFANSPSSGVSWHFLIDREGNCNFTVPTNLKAWTQGNANPFSIGIEVIAFGDEPSYIDGAGKRKLFSVTRELARRFGLPLRRGEVRDCRPVSPGIIQHADLGACGGGHHDVGPFPIGPLIDELAASACSSRCRKAKVLRGRHDRTHEELRARRCAPAARTRSARCRFLHARNTRVHAEARRAKVAL